MPKYYCDYCDTYLTHDSPSVRKTHCNGRKHKENVKFYYQKWMEEQAQNLIDATTAAFKAGKIQSGQFGQPPKPPGVPPGGAMIPPPASLQVGNPRQPAPRMPMVGPPPGMGPMPGPMPGPMQMMGPPGPMPPNMMMPGMRPPMGPMMPMGPMPGPVRPPMIATNTSQPQPPPQQPAPQPPTSKK
ncbi:U1 small nuclear ribonucleoprotein C-like isoform X2 [Centruroides vittatus]|uniref:U1 small nuclear ribonucleoprotein C-like isoform X2 n=1 Tax=Centruroides vittatus TaxID=120091 RepID=UPI00350ED1A6